MELAAGAGRGREQDLLRGGRRGEHRRDRRPICAASPRRVAHLIKHVAGRGLQITSLCAFDHHGAIDYEEARSASNGTRGSYARHYRASWRRRGPARLPGRRRRCLSRRCGSWSPRWRRVPWRRCGSWLSRWIRLLWSPRLRRAAGSGRRRCCCRRSCSSGQLLRLRLSRLQLSSLRIPYLRSLRSGMLVDDIRLAIEHRSTITAGAACSASCGAISRRRLLWGRRHQDPAALKDRRHPVPVFHLAALPRLRKGGGRGADRAHALSRDGGNGCGRASTLMAYGPILAVFLALAGIIHADGRSR